jgi:hypothetical protein
VQERDRQVLGLREPIGSWEARFVGLKGVDESFPKDMEEEGKEMA